VAQPSSAYRGIPLIGLVCYALFVPAVVTDLRAVEPPDAASSHSIRQFLTRDPQDHGYRALRRLEAENRGRTGWLEAWTTFAPDQTFQYEIVAEGGSSYIRSRVLRALLEGEKAAIERGEPGRSALADANYQFESEGLDPTGLVRIGLVPRRNEGILVAGAMFLTPVDGELVRLEGRLARSPSFWVKHVDIVRSYARIGDAVLPIALETRAQVRLLGPATLRMTYEYTEIDGRPVDRGQMAVRSVQ
jgi:hypothetical protein